MHVFVGAATRLLDVTSHAQRTPALLQVFESHAHGMPALFQVVVSHAHGMPVFLTDYST